MRDDINDIVDLFQPYADEYFLKRKPVHEDPQYGSEPEDFFVIEAGFVSRKVTKNKNAFSAKITLKVFLDDPTDNYPNNYNKKVRDFGRAKGPLDCFLTRLEKIGYDCEVREYANYWMIQIVGSDIEMTQDLLDRAEQEVKQNNPNSK